MIKKLILSLAVFIGITVTVIPSFTWAQVTTVGGGTGSTSPSGILIGVTGNLHLQTLTVGTGLTLTGTILTASGSGGTPGGLNTQIQYNNSGSFGGITGAVTDGTALSLTAPHLLNPTINGAGTGLATLTYPNTSSNATITFPTVTGTLATLAGSESLTNKSVNGVTLTAAGSSATFLNGAGAYSTPPGSTYTGTYPILVTGSVISTAFGTTTNWGLGSNGLVIVGSSGIPSVVASSSLNLPNTALQNSSVTVNGSSISLGGSATVTANTTNALTFNSSGSGAASGSTFNGSGAVTVSYNTIGAQPTIALGAGTINSSASNVLYATATSTPTVTAPITYSGTLGQFVSGISGTFGCAVASGSQAGCLSSTDWTTFNNKGSGTLTAIGVTTNQGVSGSSSGGATPNLTLTLGALTGVTSLNGLVVTANTGVITTGTWNGTTIAIANGGTGQTSATNAFNALSPLTTSGDMLYGGASGVGTRLAIGTPGFILASLNGIPTWVASTTVSNISAFKQASNYATTAALPANTYASGVLTEVGTGALSVDGSSPVVGNRILVKNEVTQSNNGIYTVTATGSGIAAYVLTRATDFNTSDEIYPGVATYVLSGTVNGDTTWVVTSTPPVVLDTTAITWVESANGNITLPISIANGGTNQTSYGTSNGITAFDGTRFNNFSGYTLTATGLTAAFASTTSLTSSGGAWFATAGGSVGVATTTPWSTFSVGTGAASSSITVAEYKYGKSGNVATSTVANIDCNASTQIAWPLGGSATTLTLINLVPGKKCIVVIQNPNGTAGAITWAIQSPAILKWTGGTIPTQTTTANTFDIWSFLATQGSSTMEVIGAATLNN